MECSGTADICIHSFMGHNALCISSTLLHILGGLGEGAVAVMGLPKFTGFSGFRQRLVQTVFGISFDLSFFFVPNNRWVGVGPTPV